MPAGAGTFREFRSVLPAKSQTSPPDVPAGPGRLTAMDNTYEPPDGDPKDQSRPTEEFWPLSQGPGGNRGPGRPDPGYQDPRDQDAHDQVPPRGPGAGPARRHPLYWTAGLVAAAALGAGGIVAGVALAGHSSPAANSSAAGPAAGPDAQAAALNAALNSADPSSALALTSSSGAAVSGGSAAARPPVRAPPRSRRPAPTGGPGTRSRPGRRSGRPAPAAGPCGTACSGRSCGAGSMGSSRSAARAVPCGPWPSSAASSSPPAAAPSWCTPPTAPPGPGTW